MKTLIVVLSLSVINYTLFILYTPVYAGGATLSLSPQSGTLDRGCNYSLDVTVDTASAATAGTDVILSYDPTRFKVNNINVGTIYAEYPVKNNDSQNGKLTISGVSSMSAAFTGSGTFATIDLTVLPAAPDGASQINFDFDPADKAKTTDSNIVEQVTISDVLSAVTNGDYVVGTSTCPLPGAKPTPGGGGTGGPVVPTVAELKPTLVPTKLEKSADMNTTMIIGASGLMLVILAALGLVLL